jgi:hypothetical protein
MAVGKIGKTGWARKLARPLTGRNGERIVTLAQARRYIVGLSEPHQQRHPWQTATRLLMRAAEGGDVWMATGQIEIALAHDAKLAGR